jgi:hypothetical protein
MLGLMPLSACAMLTSLQAECATPKTQSQCDRMNMDESETQLVTASETTCCIASEAPTPELQPASSDFSLAAPLDAMRDTASIQRQPPVLITQEFSPPSPQSLLCTFLI